MIRCARCGVVLLLFVKERRQSAKKGFKPRDERVPDARAKSRTIHQQEDEEELLISRPARWRGR